MPVLGKFTKQSAEVVDVDVVFSDWLATAGDDAASTMTVQADPGIVIGNTHLDTNTGIAKVWVSGGMDGEQYKITVTLSTITGRIKQVEVIAKIKDT